MNDITTYYLEMAAPSSLKATPAPAGLCVRECVVKQYAFNRFLYQRVGGPWRWVDKLSWSDAQGEAYAESDGLRTWGAYVEGAPAGYYELQRQAEGNVEIAYFGLAPKFIGQGYGEVSAVARNPVRVGRGRDPSGVGAYLHA